ncbi:MAG: TerB family tellurite resistance protein [Kofleriaceae bacterium]
MALPDRILPLCDLLLGAAHADDRFEDREDEEVRALLTELSGTDLSTDLEQRLASFDPKAFDLAATAKQFAGDSFDDRRRLIHLVAAINEADEEIDLAEDEYLRALAKALEMPDDALLGLVLDVEISDLREHFHTVRKGPPPPPGKKPDSAEVDIE